MVRGGSRPFLPLVFAMLLLAGGTVLAVLQIGWVNAASRAEEERARGTLARGAARVRTEAEDEIRVLLSLLRVSAPELAGRDWARAVEAADFWYQTARFPSVLRAAYIVRFPLPGSGFAYSRETNAFVETILPPDIQEGIAVAQERTANGFRPFFGRRLADGGLLFLLPAYAGIAAPSSRDAVGAVAVVVDTHVVYREVLPALMEQHLKGFPFHIVDAENGEELFRSAGAHRLDDPELTMALDSLVSFEARLAMPVSSPSSAPPRDGERHEVLLPEDPSLRFWLFRGRSEGSQLLVAGPSAQPGARVILEVYYPQKPLGTVILERRILGIGVGVGILTILVASAVVLFSLYRRSALLRASEQEFVASMSHELRTPISVIQAMSGNLADGVVVDPSRLPRYARVIHDQTRRLADMVESILFYSGLQANSARAPTLTEIDLKGLLQDVSHSLGELAAGRGSSLRLVTESVPDVICSDATALRLVLENLVTNAIRHADPGEIRLNVARRAFGGLRMTVEDGGPGIPQREQARIFDAFVRGERSIRNQRPGSGLGLHLVKRVAAMLGGSVVLESPYESLAGIAQPGCRFTVTLPLQERCDGDKER
jgi:signal transduction histidine kinase